MVALGEEITGMFAKDDELASELTAAATAAGEYFWPMPMHDHFEPLLKSSVADCKNVGPRWGGAVRPQSFCRSSSATRDGLIWISQARPGPIRPLPGRTLAPPHRPCERWLNGLAENQDSRNQIVAT